MNRIRNVLFDMGGVLVVWDPERFVRRCDVTPEDQALLLREVYRAPEWPRLDRNDLSEAEAMEAMRSRLPERLHPLVEPLVTRWAEPPLQVEGMEPLVRELSEAGLNLCLLTNAALRHHLYWPTYPVSRYFGDRIMLSADWQLMKPEAAYFEKALSLLSLDRSECVFIDDTPANVAGAEAAGIRSIRFRSADALRGELRSLGIPIRS